MNDLLRSICSKREIKQIEDREERISNCWDKEQLELGLKNTRQGINELDELESQINKNDALLGAEYWDKGL